MKNFEVLGIIDNLNWNGKKQSISIYGRCLVQCTKDLQNSGFRQCIAISNEVDRYILPLNNLICDNGEIKFYGEIDLGYVNSKDTLSPGTWNIEYLINTDENELVGAFQFEMIEEYLPKRFYNKNLKIYVDVYPNLQKNMFELVAKSRATEENLNQNKNGVAVIIKEKIVKIAKYIKEATTKTWYNLCKQFPLRENRILFLSDSRTDFSGNFAFVKEEIEKRGGYEIKWFLNPSIKTKFKLKDKFGFIYAVATSKYILLDDYYPRIYGFKLREDVELIQLWHACGAFKTFGFSRLGKEGGPKMRSINHRNYTKAIVSSEDIRRHYAEGFGISESKVKATGVPRTDVFFDEEYKTKIRKDIYESFPVLKGRKVIMFAPTFRGNGQGTAYYDFDKFNIEKMYEAFAEEYVICMKMHPFVKEAPVIEEKYSSFVIDLSKEREINDLLFVTDILITDYSSVCFEYALLDRPMIFFAYDMEEYIEKRDFYYPFKGFVPGPIVDTTEGIVEVIKNGDFKIERLEKFKNRFFSHVDGKSTERTVDEILKKGEK